MVGYIGTLGDISIRVSNRYEKEDGSYGFNINVSTDSEDGNPENDKFAICKCPEMNWYAKYGYTDEELGEVLNYVLNNTNNGELIDKEKLRD